MVVVLVVVDCFIQLYLNYFSVDYVYYFKGLINFNDNLGWFGCFLNQDLSECDLKVVCVVYDVFKMLIMCFLNSKYMLDVM